MNWYTSTFLLIFILSTFLPVFGDEETSSSASEEIILNALFSKTPELTSRVTAGETAVRLAIDDINTYLDDIGSRYHVILNITYYSGEPGSSLSALSSIQGKNSGTVIGYFSSSELEEVRDYANSNNILILSTGSSAPSLAIPNDMILRFNPDDTKQAMAIHALLKQENISYLIPLVRDDVWGRDLISSIATKTDGTVTLSEPVMYDPNENDYGMILNQLDQNTGRVLEEQIPESTAILAATFGEIVPIMEKASDPAYQNLSQIRWIGTDGNSYIPEIIRSTAATRFAADRQFIGTTLSPQPENIVLPLSNRLSEKLGYEPDASAYALYDIAWITTLANLANGSEDGQSRYTAINTIADLYNGISGEMALNENGDRSEAHYAYWEVRTDGREGKWKIIGTYSWYAPEIPIDLIFFEN